MLRFYGMSFLHSPSLGQKHRLLCFQLRNLCWELTGHLRSFKKLQRNDQKAVFSDTSAKEAWRRRRSRRWFWSFPLGSVSRVGFHLSSEHLQEDSSPGCKLRRQWGTYSVENHAVWLGALTEGMSRLSAAEMLPGRSTLIFLIKEHICG